MLINTYILIIFILSLELFCAVHSFSTLSSKYALVKRNAANCVKQPVLHPNHASRINSIGSRLYSTSDDTSLDASLYQAAGAAGVLSNIICFYSLYILRTTSCGLPPGPFGLLGAAEGVSYLVIVSIAGWSLYEKIRTGSGLPAGPFGLLGAAEGLSYLTIVGGLAIAALNLSDYGFLPGFVPNDACFGINS